MYKTILVVCLVWWTCLDVSFQEVFESAVLPHDEGYDGNDSPSLRQGAAVDGGGGDGDGDQGEMFIDDEVDDTGDTEDDDEMMQDDSQVVGSGQRARWGQLSHGGPPPQKPLLHAPPDMESGSAAGSDGTDDTEIGSGRPPANLKRMKEARTSCEVLRNKALVGQQVFYKPDCKDNGEYKPLQCHADQCWCVDADGMDIPYTRKRVIDSPPQCVEQTIVCSEAVCHCTNIQEQPRQFALRYDNASLPQCPAHNRLKSVDPEPGSQTAPNDDKDPDTNATPPSNQANPTLPTPTVQVKNKGPEVEGEAAPSAAIMARPGIMAGIIGGAVVGLLCAVLLVLFIVYRMRKKDEGSYALDEPRQSPSIHSYQRTPNREFYA